MSPELAKNIKQIRIESGVYRGSNDDFFPRFPEIKSTKDVSLDYAFLWMDLVIYLRLLKSHSHILSRIRQIISYKMFTLITNCFY